MAQLHLVFGGRVTDPQTLDFQDPSKLDVVGIFPDYANHTGSIGPSKRSMKKV